MIVAFVHLFYAPPTRIRRHPRGCLYGLSQPYGRLRLLRPWPDLFRRRLCQEGAVPCDVPDSVTRKMRKADGVMPGGKLAIGNAAKT